MASDFWLIAGLGNPGSKYEGTRHNMGFMTADVLAERWSVNFSDHKGLAMLGKGVMNLSGRNVKFFLAKPLTYMNESGNAVASISAYYQRGAHAHDNTVNWVLGGFGPDQRKQLPEFLADGADAAETIIFDGLAKAQERFNGR